MEVSTSNHILFINQISTLLVNRDDRLQQDNQNAILKLENILIKIAEVTNLQVSRKVPKNIRDEPGIEFVEGRKR